MKRILCYGDSNTWGAIPAEDNRYPAEVRWTGVMQKELGDKYLVIEEGHGGRTTVFDDPVEDRISGIRYFRACCESQSPIDMILLMLGTNDLKTRFGVEPVTIAYGLQRFLDVVNTASLAGEKPKILIAAPIQISPSYRNYPLFYAMFGEDADRRSEKFAESYRHFAEQAGVFYVNAAEYGKAAAKDGIHMDAESHKNLGIMFAQKVREILC